MKFLIPTEPDDTHAIVVQLALQELEHQATLLFTADHPTRQKNSVFVNHESYRWQSHDKYNSITSNDYDVVWWRRARKPYLPKEIIHPADYKFVVRENHLFYDAFTHNMAPKAWWINRKEAANRANFKLLQLKLANECGMTIPTTLCSNDPDEIRTFIRHHAPNNIIYKPLCSNFWPEGEQIKVAYTARVVEEDLPEHLVLQRTPGIYQTEIPKQYELRITAFGDHLVAAKLYSQDHPHGKIDWRAIQDYSLHIEPYHLPPKLITQIQQFMRELGIVFGSFDFIVTPDNNYIFLEVNEQGQFLWIEEFNPDIKMLDIFIDFIQQKKREFVRDELKQVHTIERYRNRINTVFEENMERHIDLNRRPFYLNNPTIC